jgi:hypothetical protein
MAAVNADRQPDSQQLATSMAGPGHTLPAHSYQPEPVRRLRHRRRKTSHPVAAIAADTKIPHTRGHRARKGGTNLYHGISQPGRYAVRLPRSGEGQHPPRMAWCSVRLQAALCRLQYRSLRNFTMRDIAPERDQQLARERHNGNPSHPSAFDTHACAEPSAQCAIRLMPDP